MTAKGEVTISVLKWKHVKYLSMFVVDLFSWFLFIYYLVHCRIREASVLKGDESCNPDVGP